MMERRAIAVFVANEQYREMFELTTPLMREYAERVKAEFVPIIERTIHGFVLPHKYRVREVVSEFDRTLLLDVDLVVTPSSPDIFAAVPPGHAAMLDETPYLSSHWWFEKVNPMADVRANQGLPISYDTRRFNSGVQMLEPIHLPFLAPPREPVLTTWCFEQLLITARLVDSGLPLHSLDWRWNCLANFPDFELKRQEAHFIHLNGIHPLDERARQLEQIISDVRRAKC